MEDVTKKTTFMKKYILTPAKTVFRYLFLFLAVLFVLTFISFLSLGL